MAPVSAFRPPEMSDLSAMATKIEASKSVTVNELIMFVFLFVLLAVSVGRVTGFA